MIIFFPLVFFSAYMLSGVCTMSLDRVLYSLIVGSSFVKGQWCITVSLERLIIMHIVYWYLWYISC